MLPPDLKHLRLIPAWKLKKNGSAVPGEPGVYLFFFAGGQELLGATPYFQMGGERPLTVQGKQHLYSGAARYSLRDRLYANLRADVTSSSLCRSLLAIERACGAISRSLTPCCRVVGERSLAKWIEANAFVGLETTADPYGREAELLARYSSPLNIALRRGEPYARTLSAWRCAAFPADRPDRARRVRCR